jgi:glycosyltransferase involved in cell wall biosynthesis
LFVGRIDENKRLPYIIDAWNILQNKMECADWNLVIVGDGIDFIKIREYAVALGCERIYFKGYQNPLEYYKRASIFVMASANEGFPMVLIEAQQNGCVPIVMDSFPTLHDIVKNNENGLIVKNDDIPGFIDAVFSLVSNDARRKILAQNCMETCKRFSMDNIIKQWETLFRDVVKK